MRQLDTFIVLVAALAIAGCGSDSGNPDPDGAAPEDATPTFDAAARDAVSLDAAPANDAGASDASADADAALECGVLKSGQSLAQGEQVDACSDEGFGAMWLAMQGDGNLVFYQKDVCQQPLWASGTNGKGGYEAVMQTDGDLVVLDAKAAVLWHSNTAGNPGAYAAVQGDGNLVVYTTGAKAIWDSGTWHEKPKKKLWIAQDSATADSSTQDFWRIVLDMSLNFTRMEANWSTGRALALGGYKVLGTPCSVVHSTGATISQDSSTLQCIENQTGWSIASDDVILYFPQGYGCQDGRNHWHIPVSHNGSFSVEAAFAFTGSGAKCQQALGSHEVYEASAEASAGDCCNGQDGCAATPSPYGWYSFAACGGTWWAQAVAPTPATEYSASACTKLQF